MLRNAAAFLGLCITTTTFGLVAPVAAQAPASASGEWVVPRTPDGHPDLQGNWTNASLTPLERRSGQGPACHEGNYALGNVLSGARYQERLDAENQN